MGEVAIDYGRNSHKDITLEVITGNRDCRDCLSNLAHTVIKDNTSFVTINDTRVLIGFKDKQALNNSKVHLYQVLGNFSGDFQAKFWNST